MSVYLDASVLVAFWTDRDALAARAEGLLRSIEGGALAISDFGAAEFASAVSRKVRTGETTVSAARTGIDAFDTWVMRAAQVVGLERRDIAAGAALLRRLDLTLRAPDAFHIAIAQRLGADLATFDAGLAACARALGVAVRA